MPLDLWLAFVAASTLVLMTPGPVVTLLIATGLGRGSGAALAMIPGIFLGDLVAMTLSLAGVGALLLASATLFTLLKWLGAAYLVWLGVRMWREARELGPIALPPRTARSLTAKAFLVTVSNPKSILFFVAFMPQFVAPDRPVPPQLLLLGVTFLGLGVLNDLFYMALATAGSRWLGLRVRRAVQRAAATSLIAAGILTAGLRRA